jgi:hypothetical protein
VREKGATEIAEVSFCRKQSFIKYLLQDKGKYYASGFCVDSVNEVSAVENLNSLVDSVRLQ